MPAKSARVRSVSMPVYARANMRRLPQLWKGDVVVDEVGTIGWHSPHLILVEANGGSEDGSGLRRWVWVNTQGLEVRVSAYALLTRPPPETTPAESDPSGVAFLCNEDWPLLLHRPRYYFLASP